jgi:CheY-like chemotaxis protein
MWIVLAVDKAKRHGYGRARKKRRVRRRNGRMHMSDATEVCLRGRRILIVEDNYLLADAMRAEFEEAGAKVVGPVRGVSEAVGMIAGGEPLDGAVLDINLSGEMVYRVAEVLKSKDVPFVFATGYGPGIIPAAFASVAALEKPIDLASVAKALFSP